MPIIISACTRRIAKAASILFVFGILLWAFSARSALADTRTSSPRLDLALTMWAEARGDGEKGMRMIGHVIFNRVRVGRWGDDVATVVRARGQFSVWHGRRRSLLDQQLRLYRQGRAGDSFLLALQIADNLLEQERTGRRALHDTTRGATYFLGRRDNTSWTVGLREVARHGNHRFLIAQK